MSERRVITQREANSSGTVLATLPASSEYAEGDSPVEIRAGGWAMLWSVGSCKHGGEVADVVTKRADGSTFSTAYVQMPRVIVAYNEGGYNCTQVCLECVLEVAAKL